MGNRPKRQQKPRYFTIRIQYYPIPQVISHVLSVIFFFFIFVGFGWLVMNESGSMNYELRKESKITMIHDSLFMIQQVAVFKEVSESQSKVIFHGDRTRKEIALTFDADMTSGMKSFVEQGQVASYYDKRVIDILNSSQTKATLFLSGMWIEMYQQQAKELAANPLFELASHSYSHPSFAGECFGLGEIPDSQNQEQIQKTQDLLQAVTGITNTLFRFPGGCYHESDVVSVQENGMRVIQWDVAGRDGFNDNVSEIENNVINHVQNGSIIVLHMNGYPNEPKTADALPKIINVLKEQGYQFVTVSELLQDKQTEQAFDLKQLLSYSQ